MNMVDQNNPMIYMSSKRIYKINPTKLYTYAIPLFQSLAFAVIRLIFIGSFGGISWVQQ